MKENGVEEEMANDIAGFGLVPITERYAIRIATKAYETDTRVVRVDEQGNSYCPYKRSAGCVIKDPVRTAQ